MEQVGESLLERYNKSVDPFATGFLHANNPGLIDLNACRLCFQMFLQDETTRRFTEPLKPVVSEVIYVKQGMPELVDGPLSDLSDSEPFVEITEQPHPRTLRLRYEDEGRLIAPILGVNTTANNKTFPTIRLKTRYRGRVKVIVSCVTADGPAHKPHPYSLLGEDCKHGVCMIEMNSETMSYSFNNLRLHCVKVDEVAEALRHREELLVDPFRTGFGHTNQPGSIGMDAFRLCFEVYLEGKKRGHYKKPLSNVVSDVISYKNR
ncbi:hypothetical protein AND_003708 [Anopheles darlingi]|uniref:RHD domain-containing protein n=1 Tax=Anopheles darlingi TaxID=43151 RepID=W5JK96_ANODA|nr:hypothetical protein AND_003708 [Anopheles darlingi]